MSKHLPSSLLDLADQMIPPIVSEFPTSRILILTDNPYSCSLLASLFSKHFDIFSAFPFHSTSFTSYQDLADQLSVSCIPPQRVSSFINDLKAYILVSCFSFGPILAHLKLLPAHINP